MNAMLVVQAAIKGAVIVRIPNRGQQSMELLFTDLLRGRVFVCS